MGLRHLTILNGQHEVVGIITRQDLVEHRLEHHEFDEEGQQFHKFITLDNSKPLVVHEDDNTVIFASGIISSANIFDKDTEAAVTPREASHVSATATETLHTVSVNTPSFPLLVPRDTSVVSSQISTPLLVEETVTPGESVVPADTIIGSSSPAPSSSRPSNALSHRQTKEPKSSDASW